jgi:hypothetical protein
VSLIILLVTTAVWMQPAAARTLMRWAGKSWSGVCEDAGANKGLPLRSIRREWAPDVYDLDALDSYLYYMLCDEL